MLMLSGMVSTSRYPLTAQMKASPMPVLPLVGSTMRVSLSMRPALCAASIMLMPMRSFTEEHGLKNSSFAATFATQPSVTLLSATRGVLPTRAIMSFAMFTGPPFRD
jgi:hypothetical protein